MNSDSPGWKNARGRAAFHRRPSIRRITRSLLNRSLAPLVCPVSWWPNDRIQVCVPSFRFVSGTQNATPSTTQK
jgi:hypothetical protein